MQLERDEILFARELERAILKILSGDDQTVGLYRSVLSAANWDAFNRVAGQIAAYESILAEMQRIAKRMEGDSPRARTDFRAMN